MKVVGLADGVEDAVCVRAGFGVQEREGAFGGGWDGIEAESGEEGWSYHFCALWGGLVCVGLEMADVWASRVSSTREGFGATGRYVIGCQVSIISRLHSSTPASRILMCDHSTNTRDDIHISYASLRPKTTRRSISDFRSVRLEERQVV